MLVGRGVGRMGRTGRPGLLRTTARTEVMAGSATATTAATAVADGVAQLQALADMHDQGLLSDEEFAAAKTRLLGL